ncbi:MAG: restriction endonuclease subunit S [Ruminococcus sp.]
MKLTDICEFHGGSQPPKSEWSSEYKDGYIRMLQIRDFTQEGRVTPEYVKISNRLRLCTEDDILIGRYGASVGKILSGKSGAYNVAIMKAVPDTSVVRKQYLRYYFLSPNFQNYILNLGGRAAQAGFSKDDLARLEITVVSLEEQDKIVNELSTLEKTISTKQKQLKEFDDLVKSRFIEMFGDIRISSIFPNIALENFAQIGSSKRVHAADYVESGVPFYRSKEIIELGNGQEPSVELFISKKQYESIKKTNGVPCKGDILMSAVGTIGKMWIVDGRKDFYYKDGNIISIHSDETNPIYLKEALANLIDDFKSANVAGSAYSALTIVKLKKMTVPMPPMSIQNEFADFVKLIDKSKFIVQKQIDDLQELLDSKMDEYFG